MVAEPTTAERKRLYAEAMAPGSPPYMTIDKGALAKLLEDLQSAQAEAKALTEQLGIAARGYHMNAGHSGLLEGCEILRCLSFTHFLEAS